MPKLKRELGLFEATVYGVGIILGAGIYALIGQAAGLTGNSLWLSFAVGAVIASFTGLSYAELATMIPKAAAEYTYLKKTGSRLLGFLVGWLMSFAGVAAAATVALGFAGYFNGLFNLPITLVAIGLVLILSYINFRGIKDSSTLNIVFTAVEAIGLIIVILLGLTVIGKTEINYLEMTNGVGGVLSAAALVFFAYIGFEDIANIAEETKRPRRILHKAFIASIVITTVLYILVSIATVSLANSGELAASEAPLALAVSKTFLGNNAYVVMSYIALFATANTVLIIISVTARMVYGMSVDGSLPKILARIHNSRKTPHTAIFLLAAISVIFIFLGNLNVAANMANIIAFIAFALVNASLIWLRFKYPKMKRPFKSPVNIGKFPVLAFLGLLTCIFMIFQFELKIMIYTSIVLITGTVVYYLMKRKIIA